MYMKEDNLEELFDQLEGEFDIENPEKGHQDRFLKKLNTSKNTVVLTQPRKRNLWKPLSIAASLLFLISLGLGITKNSTSSEEIISPEIQETQLYFSSLLEEEIEKLNTIADKDTQVIIDDVMLQLQKLETDYDNLKRMLIENGNDKQILYAMITNFQTRVDLLKDVIYRIEEIKQQQKLNENENNII